MRALDINIIQVEYIVADTIHCPHIIIRRRALPQIDLPRCTLSAKRLKCKRFTLTALNAAIAELVAQLNDRMSRHLGASRRALFEELERPALKPLPAEPYVFAAWKECRVGLDYHVEIEKHYYSAPHQLLREKVWARITARTVELFHRGKRVAAHVRASSNRKHTTVRETLDQLRALKLDGMAQAFLELEAQEESRNLAHAEWLALLLDREAANRNTKRFLPVCRSAGLVPGRSRTRHRPAAPLRPRGRAQIANHSGGGPAVRGHGIRQRSSCRAHVG